jgi:hypothetical protein
MNTKRSGITQGRVKVFLFSETIGFSSAIEFGKSLSTTITQPPVFTRVSAG